MSTTSMPANYDNKWFPNSSQFVGSYAGLAIGDFVGAVIEGNPPYRCKEIFQEVVNYVKISSKVSPDQADRTSLRNILLKGCFTNLNGHFPFGQVTDDTQLARELGFTILECGADFSSEIFANRIAQLYKEHRMVGAGPATAVALTKIISGISSSRSGGAGYGNGPVVRSLALGLIHCKIKENDYHLFKQKITNQSEVTHSSSFCSEAAITYNISIGLALHYGINLQRYNVKLDPVHYLEQLIYKLRNIIHQNSQIVEYILQLKHCIERNYNQMDALKMLSCIGGTKSYQQKHNYLQDGVNGDAVSSLLWSLFCFLKYANNDFVYVLQAAVEGGGDTDSVGALSCSLWGSYRGREDIPPCLTGLIDDQGEDFTVLENLGLKLFDHFLLYNNNEE